MEVEVGGSGRFEGTNGSADFCGGGSEGWKWKYVSGGSRGWKWRV